MAHRTKDSFIVANAAYVDRVTGSNDVGTFLIGSSTPKATAERVAAIVASTGATVDDIASARARVITASGLAATDLSGLARLELGFGLVSGLVGGAAVGSAIAYLLVKVLTGIFDPAPDHATVPWGYLGLLVGLTLVTASAIVAVMGRVASRAGWSALREL